MLKKVKNWLKTICKQCSRHKMWYKVIKNEKSAKKPKILKKKKCQKRFKRLENAYKG